MDSRRSHSAPSANRAECQPPEEVSSVLPCADAGPAQKDDSTRCLLSPNCKFTPKICIFNVCESPGVRISPYLTDSKGNIIAMRSFWVVAGVAALSTADAVAQAKAAEAAGASGLMILPPYVYLGDW